MESVSEESFREILKSLVPKNHTQAEDFIKKNPDYDGRQVKIAIWDTGVDPAAEGLQITTEGKPKLTYMCDTSGSGHLSLNTEIKFDTETRKLRLLSDRIIDVPKSWNIRDNILRLGLKSASEIFPSILISRLSKDYREQVWNKEMNRLLLESNNLKRVAPEQPNTLSEIEPTNLLECLDIIDKTYEFPVPVFDCIVFHDGQDYVAFIDTTPLNPDLSIEDIPLLKSFYIDRQYNNFGGKTNLNFGVNIWEDGQVLEIVTCSGSHGTHVASIAAGYFPESPECNGIAPGAEVVSMKISDTRLGSMETGIALAMAAQRTIELKCDIVNLSFGEASVQPNCGKICKIMRQLVTKHGIVFCSSSGNSGPALSTVGSPGGTTDGLFGISPMVFPDMIQSNYSLLTNEVIPNKAQVYTWSSRGPTTDGSLGIHVAAPGAAITSVGNWQNRNIGLMNGSSMSSPNACGGLSLLISAAHQNNRSLSPWIISVATANSAKVYDNISRLSQGYGLLQISDAYQYIQQYWEISDKKIKNTGDESLKPSDKSYSESMPSARTDMDNNDDDDENHIGSTKNKLMQSKSESALLPTFNQISCHAPLNKFRIKCLLSNGDRGVHFREPWETNRPRQVYVSIAPDFEEMNIDIKYRPKIKMYLHIFCKASWVECPKFFTLYNQERTITVKIDPTKLERNLPEFQAPECLQSNPNSNSGVYFTEIEFFCLEYSQIGPLARLPVTVFMPESCDNLQMTGRAYFTPDKKINRLFICTLMGSNSLLLTVNPVEVVEGSSRFDLRLINIQPNASTISSELSKYMLLDKKLDITAPEQVAYSFNCINSCTVEMVLAQYWSALNSAVVDYSVEFHGLNLSSTDVKVLSSDHYCKLLIESNIRTEEVAPAININYLVCPIKPFKEDITYVQQEICDYKEIININLFYQFTNPKPGEVGVFCPALGNLLYENDFLSQMYQIYDSHDRIVGTGDYKPDIIFRKSTKYFFKLDKGEFRICLQVKHTKMTQIEKLKEQGLQIYFKTFANLNFEFSRSLIDINCNRSKSTNKMTFSLGKGEKTSLFITSNILKVLKSFTCGNYLCGTISLYKNEALKKAVAYPFQFIFTSNVNPQNHKLEPTLNYKLNQNICQSLFNYLMITNRSKSLDPDNYKKELGSSVSVNDSSQIDHIEESRSIETVIKNLALKTEESGTDNLIKYFLSCFTEFRDKDTREDLNTIVQLINGDESELKLYNLRALNKFSENDQEKWNNIEELSEILIETFDTKELADYCGTKFTDPSISLSKETKLKLDKQKSNLIEVLNIYGTSLADRLIKATETTDPAYSDELIINIRGKLDSIYSKTCRFVSPWENNGNIVQFFLSHSLAVNCPVRFMKMLLKSYENQPNLSVIKLIQQIMMSLNWKIFANHYNNLCLIKHPTLVNITRDLGP